MTTAPTRSNSSVGMIALLLIVLVDIALLAWFWYRRQNSQDNYGNTAMTLPVVQPVEPITPLFLPPGTEADSHPGPPGPAAPHARVVEGSRSVSAPPDVLRGQTAARVTLPRTSSAFIHLQRQDKYRKSKALRAWRRDFLAYPDLAQINRKYWRDRDAGAFIVATLKSPNFASLFKRYATRSELRDFTREMISAPGVLAEAQPLLTNPSVMAAAKNFSIPGLPPLGNLMNLGQRFSTDEAQALREMEKDPRLRKYLEQQKKP
ncbi:MAG: hypothetical protein HY551_04075 [Elusimicrobia bacterium]|nr:hypothetical protein [Elusimicrobiota bacterium]